MNFWVIIYRFSWITLGVLFVVGIACMFYPQYQQYQEYQRREAELREQIRLEEEMRKTLKQKQERFNSDREFVERIAHEIGLAKEDEIIFKFVDEEEPPAGPGP